MQQNNLFYFNNKPSLNRKDYPNDRKTSCFTYKERRQTV